MAVAGMNCEASRVLTETFAFFKTLITFHSEIFYGFYPHNIFHFILKPSNFLWHQPVPEMEKYEYKHAGWFGDYPKNNIVFYSLHV